MNQITLFFVLFSLLSWNFAQASEEPLPSLPDLIVKAEKDFYQIGDPDHYDRVLTTLKEIEKRYPKEPYAYWAQARVAFFEKENFYGSEQPKDIDRKKFELAEICHDQANKCINLDPKNPECHLLKGSCYAMQASTWGVGLKTLNVCKIMDDEWEKAMSYPSTFNHQDGVTTKQFAQILRAILFRVMPDSWWFRFLSGIRGDKEKSYAWMKEAVIGVLLSEPFLVLEKAASTICLARVTKNPELAIEGMALLQKGMALPTRYPLDDFDKRNMGILKEKPEEACNYRRERFEDLSDEAISSKVK